MIKVTGLSRQFDKRGIAGIHNLTFSLTEGEVMGIMGPNGSGKTTLLKILGGEIIPDAGSFNVTNKISFFPRQENLSNGNVQKILVEAVTLEMEEEKKIQLARDLADTFEFTFQLRQTLNELSSGQKQKVLLARELINRPGLLLMDEPFTHLDPFTRRDILKGLFQYISDQNITVLWVTHDTEEAFKYSDRIALMNFGKFEQIDSPEIIVKNPQNLFVAKFIGYRNFFTVRSSSDGLITPWGTISFPGISSAEGILIIPDDVWEINEAGLPMTVVSHHAGHQSIEYLLTYQERTFYWRRGAQLKTLESGIQVRLLPRWTECLSVPL
jgi:ABC-type Fe3+/spermidine/putrescine transport system ATPase subunit